MSWNYVRPTNEHLGYWRGYDPSAKDIDEILRDSGESEDYRILIHGEPCRESPNWASRHAGEAQAGQATYPYNVSSESIVYAINIAYLYAETGYADEYEEVMNPDANFATNFANVLIGSTEEDCWASVQWIDFIDLE